MERAKAYLLFSRVYEKELTEELYSSLKSVFDFDDSNLEDPLEELACDYARIFLGAGEAKGNAAFPYESLYTSKVKLLMGDAYEAVKKIYAKHGLILNASLDLKEDHLASELKYVAWLYEKGLIEEAKQFVSDHLLNWIPSFSKDVEKYATLSFYPAVTKELLSFLKEE